MNGFVFFDSVEDGHLVDDPLMVVSVDPDFSCLGLNLERNKI